MTTPIWLLDVDGVINALPWRGDATDESWDDYATGYASPSPDRGPNRGYEITYSPTLLARIRELHESGAVEVRWLTTWGHGANGESLRALTGLPELEVAGDPMIVSGFAGAPSRYWWKFDDARRVREEEPDRPIIWTDDDLKSFDDACKWASENNVFAIAPDDVTGLTPLNLHWIEQFVEESRGYAASA